MPVQRNCRQFRLCAKPRAEVRLCLKRAGQSLKSKPGQTGAGHSDALRCNILKNRKKTMSIWASLVNSTRPELVTPGKCNPTGPIAADFTDAR
jgi:hypothetical protein